MFRNQLPRAIAAATICLTLAGFAGRSHAQGAPAGAAPGGGAAKSPAPVPVRAGVVTQRDVPVRLKGVGIAEPSARVRVKSQVTGKVEKVHFRDGDAVKKGDLLFTIDSRPFVAEFNATKANLERDRVETANARREYERYKELAAKGAAAVADLDRYRSVAEAGELRVSAGEAALASAQLKIDYCLIKSPMDGRVGRVQVDAGNLVKENDTATMVEIVQIRPVYVGFSIPERYLPQIRRNQATAPLAVELVHQGIDEEPAGGVLTFIDNEVDRDAGTIRLIATVANDDLRLWPGEYCEVSLLLDTRKDAIVLATSAIQPGQKGSFVYAIDGEGKAAVRGVKVIDEIGRESIVEGDLKPGDRIVTDGQLRVAPGATVKVIEGDDAP